MKTLILFILLCTLLNVQSAAATKLIVKVNVLAGGDLVTHEYNALELRTFAEGLLSQKGYEMAVTADSSVHYLDLFLFEHPIDRPRMSLTYRSRAGLHYFDIDDQRGKRNLAGQRLITNLIERLPLAVEQAETIELSFDQFLALDKLKPIKEIGAVGGPAAGFSYITLPKAPTWFVPSFEWPGEPPGFVIEYQLKSYLLYCMSHQLLASHLEEAEILLQLRVNERGAFEYEGCRSSTPLTKELESRLIMDIASFPSWICSGEVEEVYMHMQ